MGLHSPESKNTGVVIFDSRNLTPYSFIFLLVVFSVPLGSEANVGLMERKLVWVSPGSTPREPNVCIPAPIMGQQRQAGAPSAAVSPDSPQAFHAASIHPWLFLCWSSRVRTGLWAQSLFPDRVFVLGKSHGSRLCWLCRPLHQQAAGKMQLW